MLSVILGTDWVSIREEIFRRIAADVRTENGRRILMVPELISHDTERRLCACAGDTASRYAEVLSFTRLARRVAESVGNGAPACMDNGGRLVAMAAAARQLHSRLKAYASVETKPEFLTDLVDAMDEFKRCCIWPEDLRDAAQRAEGSLAQKLTELSLLLETYDALCMQGKRDPRDQMNWLMEQLEDGSFSQEHVFYIDGFPDFTRQHMAILEHLIRTSPGVTIGINCDRVASPLLAFEKAGDTASQLIRSAQRDGVAVSVYTVPGRQNELTKVCQGLFQGPVFEIDREYLRVLTGNTPWDEVSFAAQRVQELVQSGCRYRDISIVCGELPQYADLIRLVFRKCGIPVYLSGTEDILQRTVVATVLSALEAALGGFEQRDVLRYFRSCLSPLSQDLCDQVENYAILWGIRGKQWLTPWEKHPDGLGEVLTESSAKRLAYLNEARERAIAPLSHLYEEFCKAKNLSQQVLALYRFLEEIRLAKRLENMARNLDDEQDNRSAQILNQLWDILMTALEQLHDVLGQTVWEPQVFIRLLTLLLSQYDVGTIPPVLDAVTVGAADAMRCQQEKHLIVLGASEGALPGYGGSSGVFTDQERVALRKMDVPLTGGALEGIQAEFAEIYGVFCGAEDSITVTCSGPQPSYVFRRLSQMAGGSETIEALPISAAADPQQAAYRLAYWKEEIEAGELGLREAYLAAKGAVGYEIGAMEPQTVRALYGECLNLSASQVDRQAECRMSYFLKYGMRAKERKEAQVDPAEFGTYVHAVLENTARRVMECGGFARVSLEETMEIARDYSDEYARERFRELDSERGQYLFRRNRRELEMVVAELWNELKDSRFLPVDFETAFGGDGDLPAIDVGTDRMGALLRGFVDRVDVWQEDGRNYFRVVDYKTGKKDFDYTDILCGVGLQMLLYLFALQQGGESVVGTNSKAAGVQYFPARVPLVSSDGHVSDQEADQLRLKEWRRKGLLLADEAVLEAMEPGEVWKRLCCTRKKDGTISGDLADREQMKLLEHYVFHILHKLVDEIASGDVTPNPYTRGTAHNACSFCPFGAVCRCETVSDRRNYEKVSSQRFWEEVEKEVGYLGGKTDTTTGAGCL